MVLRRIANLSESLRDNIVAHLAEHGELVESTGSIYSCTVGRTEVIFEYNLQEGDGTLGIREGEQFTVFEDLLRAVGLPLPGEKKFGTNVIYSGRGNGQQNL